MMYRKEQDLKGRHLKSGYLKSRYLKVNAAKSEYTKKKCRTEEYLKGSYTVEASVVISLVFWVLGALLLCSFYIHDKSVLQGLVCEAAAAGSNFATEKEQKEAVSSVKKKITASRFMGSKNLSGSISAGEKSAGASWNAVFPVPGFAAKYLLGNRLTIKKEWTSKIFDPAKTIRKVRGAEKLFRIESG